MQYEWSGGVPMKARSFVVVACLALVLPTGVAKAQSVLAALSRTYSTNPQLNAARAELRSIDEQVSIAKAGYRPRADIQGTAGYQYFRSENRMVVPGPAKNPRVVTSDTFQPVVISLNLIQPLFDGFRTTNQVKQAVSLVYAQRQGLRATEQDVLLDAAEAYFNVIRDTALVSLNESNVAFLKEQVRAAQARFEVGEGTRTDVAQAEARLQLAIANLNLARANLNASRAFFRQIVGIDPGRLDPRSPIEKFLPKSLAVALAMSQKEHPSILAGVHQVDAAAFLVKTFEAALLPTLDLQGTASRAWDQQGVDRLDQATIQLRARVPIYQGGAEYAQIRQSKEQLGQARLQLDQIRDQVRAAVVQTWGNWEAAGAAVTANRAQVEAAQLALAGVIEEQKVGQRTTLDVLNAQAELITARANLVGAERNRSVAAFSLVAAVGRLDADHLHLKVEIYDPTHHLDVVQDKWFGLRTPDGR